MGQYHILVNWDKKEFVDPHKIGLGFKMGEQIGNLHASMGDILYLLVAISHGRGGGDVPTHGLEDTLGRWAGDRVLVVGDYSREGDVDIKNANGNLIDPYKEIYAACDDDDLDLDDPDRGQWSDISIMIDHMVTKLWGYEMIGSGWRERELVNTDTYLGPWESKEDNKGLRPDMVIGLG